jgi:Zn-dependent M32 family carboxypeptidase
VGRCGRSSSYAFIILCIVLGYNAGAGYNRNEVVAMDQQQQQQRQINEAAEQFSEALMESFRASTEHTALDQEINAQLTQDFFNRVIENLRTQAEDTRQVGQQLADQQQRAIEAGRTLTQESVDAYMEFVKSMFSFWQGAKEKPWPRYPLFDSGDPTFAERVDEELAGFGEQ